MSHRNVWKQVVCLIEMFGNPAVYLTEMPTFGTLRYFCGAVGFF